MIKGWLFNIRNWLIIKLAGDSTVVINAEFQNGGMVVESEHSVIINTTLYLEARTYELSPAAVWSPNMKLLGSAK